MNISVLQYCLKQISIERTARVMGERMDRNTVANHYANRFKVGVHANSTYKVYSFASKPTRKQVSACIRDAVKCEIEYQAEHKAKFGWCRT